MLAVQFIDENESQPPKSHPGEASRATKPISNPVPELQIPAVPGDLHNESETLLCSTNTAALEFRSGLLGLKAILN